MAILKRLFDAVGFAIALVVIWVLVVGLIFQMHWKGKKL